MEAGWHAHRQASARLTTRPRSRPGITNSRPTKARARPLTPRGRIKQRIDRVLTIEGKVDDEQKKRMADIAERTPVTLTLKGGLEIRTSLSS